jgi:hypothetical protein
MANPVYPDLSIPIRSAIVANQSIMSNMPDYANGDAVFTRRPTPIGAPYPMIVIGPDIGDMDIGGLNDQRLKIKRDIAVYSTNDTPDNYRLTETIAFAVRTLFHRNRTAITVTGWRVVNIWAKGPMMTPVQNEDEFVARTIEITVELDAVMT